MKLDKDVPHNVTQAVHSVLEDFCNTASKRLDIEIDSRYLDIEPGKISLYWPQKVLTFLCDGGYHRQNQLLSKLWHTRGPMS